AAASGPVAEAAVVVRVVAVASVLAAAVVVAARILVAAVAAAASGPVAAVAAAVRSPVAAADAGNQSNCKARAQDASAGLFFLRRSLVDSRSRVLQRS